MNQEYLKSVLFYKDGALYWRVKPNKNIAAGTRAGSKRPDGYRHIRLNKKFYQEHILIWWMENGERPELFIDHINMVRDDNRIENLRLATMSQNLCNRKAPSNNTSGHKGVSFNKKQNRYVAYLMVKGVHRYLGTYKTFDAAKHAHETECKATHGAFANY